LLQPIQHVATQLSMGSIRRRTAAAGTSSLNAESVNSGTLQNSVFRASRI